MIRIQCFRCDHVFEARRARLIAATCPACGQRTEINMEGPDGA